MSRTRKLSLISTAFAVAFVLIAGVGVNAQTIINTSKSNVKDRIASPSESRSAKGWGGKVHGKALVTPVIVSLSDPQDYDHIVSGEIRLNLILNNTLSGQTVRLDGKQLRESFRPGADKSRLTVNVIVDNMSAPLSEAACGVITAGAENRGDDVNITLSYGACGGGPAQRPGSPVIGVIVHGGKHPHGDMNIMVGDSRVVTREAAAQMSRVAGVIPGPSSKGTGSPKAAGF